MKQSVSGGISQRATVREWNSQYRREPANGLQCGNETASHEREWNSGNETANQRRAGMKQSSKFFFVNNKMQLFWRVWEKTREKWKDLWVILNTKTCYANFMISQGVKSQKLEIQDGRSKNEENHLSKLVVIIENWFFFLIICFLGQGIHFW